MATLKFILNKKANKDGKHAIYLRLTHNRKPTTIRTGIVLFYEEWNSKDGQINKIKGGTPNIEKIRHKLNKLIVEKRNRIDKLKETDNLYNYSVTQLRNVLEGKEDKITVFDFWEDFMNNQKTFNKINTKKAYFFSLKSLKKFRKNIDLRFEQIDYNFMTSYEKWFLNRGTTYNGFANRMHILKAIYNEAVKRKIVSRDSSLDNYKVKKTPTVRRSLTYEEFEKVKDIDLSKSPKLERARELFLISYNAGGMPFIDLVKLKFENIIDNGIYYKRSKTGSSIIMPIMPELQKILKPYLEVDKRKGFIFPYILNDDSFKMDNDYKKAWGKYNYYLKKVGKLCGLKKPLTTYVARHTFATLMLKKYNLPSYAVKDFMGHSNLNMTETYIDRMSLVEGRKLLSAI